MLGQLQKDCPPQSREAIVHSCLIVLCSRDSIRLCVLLKKQVRSVFIFVYSKRRGWNLG